MRTAVSDVEEPRSRWRPGVLPRLYAGLVVALRWPIVAAWVIAAVASVIYLPTVGQGGSDLEQLVSADNPAIRSEVRSFDKFGFPLLSRVAVVQRNPAGLPQPVQQKAIQRARDVSNGTYPDATPIRAAVPVMNSVGLIPGSNENGTTIVTLLFTEPNVNFVNQVAAAKRFVAKHYDRGDTVVGITGSVPARVEQADIVQSSVPRLELITIAAVFLIVAVAFRSLVAPVVALVVAGIASLLTLHVGGVLALRLGVPVPQETQPMLVALLLGVVTDYVVFYLSAVRRQLAAGDRRLTAARQATARFTPIIVVAGAAAAAGTAALIVAGSPAFRAFGPGMALAILIGMVVAVTLVPALLAILGPKAFWSPRRRSASVDRPEAATAGARWWARLLTRRWFAFPMLLLCAGGLILAALPLRHISLGVSFVDALPANNPTRVAAAVGRNRVRARHPVADRAAHRGQRRGPAPARTGATAAGPRPRTGRRRGPRPDHGQPPGRPERLPVPRRRRRPVPARARRRAARRPRRGHRPPPATRPARPAARGGP